jgi:large subunit ribosomal protein L20
MIHVKKGIKKQTKKIRQNGKGYFGVSKGNLRIILERMVKGLQHRYCHLKSKKRNDRSLWIQRLNAGLREHGITYSQFIYHLNESNLIKNRRILSEIMIHEPITFKKLVEHIKVKTIHQIVTTTNSNF